MDQNIIVPIVASKSADLLFGEVLFSGGFWNFFYVFSLLKLDEFFVFNRGFIFSSVYSFGSFAVISNFVIHGIISLFAYKI
jgi:hypothetical protein